MLRHLFPDAITEVSKRQRQTSTESAAANAFVIGSFIHLIPSQFFSLSRALFPRRLPSLGHCVLISAVTRDRKTENNKKRPLIRRVSCQINARPFKLKYVRFGRRGIDGPRSLSRAQKRNSGPHEECRLNGNKTEKSKQNHLARTTVSTENKCFSIDQLEFRKKWITNLRRRRKMSGS